VPGDVHRALIAVGRIEDPFYDQNEFNCAWIEEREWWYRVHFDGTDSALRVGERLRLVFHGLDTFATIWLNGVELGRHHNMFTELVFDVTDYLHPGQQNVLALCFDPPMAHASDPSGFIPWGRNPERVYMRKAQFGFGWDWGPRLPTVGIWRPVELRRERLARITGVHFYTVERAADNQSALVAVKVEVEPFATDLQSTPPLIVNVRLSSPVGGREVIEQIVTIASPEAIIYLSVKRPDWWWTHDLGTPVLYDLEVTLNQGDVTLDQQKRQVGIRMIELDQSPDPEEPGTRFFRFVLNGVSLFAKRANWIPADSFVGSISDARYETLLTATRDGNMNMLRVWGGGIYEHDVFYNLCDSLGILVWQDFLFSCASYPDHNAEYTREVQAEVDYQVRRLRSHPCLALWCGNNENQWLHEMQFWAQPEYHAPGALYYNHLLPETVARLDGHVPYWPGSPYGGDDYNSMEDGDRHNWQVWHGMQPRRFGEPPVLDQSASGVSFSHCTEDVGRFISEFGMHASPVLETLRRCIPADQLFHHSPSMDHHNKDNPKNKGDNLMLTCTGLPESLEEYIDFSMIAQAEGLKYGIEHFRRRKSHCSGTLFWQLNDCWPVLSWSVLDYYGVGKAGYYYVRRAFAPALASFKSGADGLELWITNDRLSEISDTAIVHWATFSGQVLLHEEIQVRIPGN